MVVSGMLVAFSLATAADTTELRGVWRLVAAEAGGEDFPLPEGQPRLAIEGDWVEYAGKPVARVSADPTAGPKVIDLTFPTPDRTYEGVYALDGDRLRVCLNARSDGPKERASELSTKDRPQWRLLTFERVKGRADLQEGLTGFVGLMLTAGDGGKGVAVSGVFMGSPAEKAGLRTGDLLERVGDAEPADLLAAVNAVRGHKPGAKLTLRVRRGGEAVSVTAEVAVFPFDALVGLE